VYPIYLSSHVPEMWRADAERADVDEQNIDASKRPAKRLRNLLLGRPIEGDDQFIAAEFLCLGRRIANQIANLPHKGLYYR
jgi:hypothetical protein